MLHQTHYSDESGCWEDCPGRGGEGRGVEGGRTSEMGSGMWQEHLHVVVCFRHVFVPVFDQNSSHASLGMHFRMCLDNILKQG